MNTTELGTKHVRVARYYNCNRYSCAVIAVITEGIDWAAYMNGYDGVIATQEETIEFVKNYGAKLSEKDAKYYFPNILTPYRR